jgi:hypothetical protein
VRERGEGGRDGKGERGGMVESEEGMRERERVEREVKSKKC